MKRIIFVSILSMLLLQASNALAATVQKITCTSTNENPAEVVVLDLSAAPKLTLSISQSGKTISFPAKVYSQDATSYTFSDIQGTMFGITINKDMASAVSHSMAMGPEIDYTCKAQ